MVVVYPNQYNIYVLGLNTVKTHYFLLRLTNTLPFSLALCIALMKQNPSLEEIKWLYFNLIPALTSQSKFSLIAYVVGMSFTYLFLSILVKRYFWAIGVFSPELAKNVPWSLTKILVEDINFPESTLQLTSKEANRWDPSRQLTNILMVKLTSKPNWKKLESMSIWLLKLRVQGKYALRMRIHGTKLKLIYLWC